MTVLLLSQIWYRLVDSTLRTSGKKSAVLWKVRRKQREKYFLKQQSQNQINKKSKISNDAIASDDCCIVIIVSFSSLLQRSLLQLAAAL